jgi:hypothetical protein
VPPLEIETRLIAPLHPQNISETHPENSTKDHLQDLPQKHLENFSEYPLQKKSKSHRGGITGEHNPMLHQNLSRVIRWYTGRVTYEAHKTNPDFNWQRRFHDRIIRDPEEFKIKAEYIQQNILNWKEDEFY